ncbi:MAG TPA: VOC family protein [Actinomycetota bacterium]
MQRIDHAVFATTDLDAAADRWAGTHGLTSTAGGSHPRWGTANRIVPLGRDYLELIAVTDPELARTTVLGRTLLGLLARGDAWFSVCVADDDIETTAARLGLDVEPGSRTRPDGQVVRWRGAGIDAPQRSLDLPFFIAWDVPPGLHPGASPPEHPCGATGIAAVEETGDAEAVRRWLGADLPIRVRAGEPGVVAVRLATPSGELRID